ncbi:MAG: hypothetical protein JWQ28_3228 [Pedobacter sp.]|jgi:hypothetical protein|nr:hypothetical protein [Pedobacter sp.]
MSEGCNSKKNNRKKIGGQLDILNPANSQRAYNVIVMVTLNYLNYN